MMKKKLFAALTAALMLGSTMAAPVSAAETYKKGDVNMDGDITVADAQMVLEQYTLFFVGAVNEPGMKRYYNLTEEQESLANITGTTTKSLRSDIQKTIPFSVADAQMILLYATDKLSGKEVPDDIEEFAAVWRG